MAAEEQEAGPVRKELVTPIVTGFGLSSWSPVSPSMPKSMSLVPAAHHPQEQAGPSLVNLLSHAFADF